MAKLEKKVKDMLEESEGYVILTENGVCVDMKTGTVLACVTTLLKTMKDNESIDDDAIDKVCELAKVDKGNKGIVQLLKKMADLLEELED